MVIKYRQRFELYHLQPGVASPQWAVTKTLRLFGNHLGFTNFGITALSNAPHRFRGVPYRLVQPKTERSF